jgi:hypothetical protein
MAHLPKLCPVIPTSNQDGHQAKNRKKDLYLSKSYLSFNRGDFVLEINQSETRIVCSGHAY